MENNNFEHTKMVLYNAEQVENVKNNPIVKATILSLVKQIPLLGDFVDETTDIVLTKFQEKKRNELLNIILTDAGHITSEMVNDVEFIINFAKTLDAVNRLSSNDKVQYFANIIKNGYFVENKIANDDFDEYLFSLSTLSYRQINILIELYRHEIKYVSDDESSNKLASRNKVWTTFLKKVKDDCGLDNEDVVSILSSISRTGFCAEITGAYYGYTGGVFYITNNCKKFAKIILGNDNQ